MMPFHSREVYTSFMWGGLLHVVLVSGTIFRLQDGGMWTSVCYLPQT